MKQIALLLFIVLNATLVFGQAKKEVRSPSSFFPGDPTKVLVVGSFHFDYPNLDVNKIKDSNKIDVLSEPKKTEVTELVNYIKRFRPNKIAIEAFPNWNATEKLRQYKLGELRDKRDERYQLAMRIATELKLDTLYAIDSESFDDELVKLDSQYFREMFKDFDFVNEDKYIGFYKDWYNYEQGLQSQMPLLEYFKHINTKKYHQVDYGAYLVGDFKLDEHRGADILSIWWYNRNLRIFRKLQEITGHNGDRLLVIIGNGHAAVLRQMLESSPEFEFIEFDKLK